MARKSLGKIAKITLRVLPDEKVLITGKAERANKTINDYCSDILKNYEYADKLAMVEEIEGKKLKYLSSIANNINQLAAKCNALQIVPQREVLLEILKELKRL